MDYEPKCPVTGKRKYDTEGEALSTATHQISTNNAPSQLRPYMCTYCEASAPHQRREAQKKKNESGSNSRIMRPPRKKRGPDFSPALF